MRGESGVEGETLSDDRTGHTRRDLRTAIPYGIAAAYVAAHVPFLPSALEDIDSVNFALALEKFDLTLHQPHPPGYPVYVALGRASLALISSLWPAMSRISAEALALSIWSVMAGAVAIVASWHLFAALQERDARPPTPLVATMLLATAPLFWVTGLRPMSDMPGLAVALLAQALLLRGLSNSRRLIEGALIAGLAAGVRSQTLWLTMPLLLIGLARQRRAGPIWLLSRPIAAAAAGALAWAIPLVFASGGPEPYWTTLKTQALDDVRAVDMLWLDPTARRLATGVIATLSAQWGSTLLTIVALTAATVGGLAAFARGQSGIALLAIAFGPYAAFHLLFQDALTARYTLPLAPALAWLAARGLVASRIPGTAPTSLFIVGALAVGMSDAMAYSRESHPVFRAVEDVERTDGASARVAYAHSEVWRGLQASAAGLQVVEPRQQHAWMGLVEYWKNGGTAPVWFFANPDRTDLALIDPHSRRDVVHYAWAVAGRPEFRGTRPLAVDRYRFSQPGWVAGEGWSLTPETGGLAYANGKGLQHGPIEAFVLRRPGPMHAVIGGYLIESSHTNAHLELTVDGVVVDRWVVTTDSRRFVRFVDLPSGVSAGPANYATLSIRPRPGVSGDPPAIFIRQFDIQPASRLIYAFAEGWHTQELDPATGRLWRWTSGRSVLRVKGPVQDLRLTLRGESPLRYFDSPPGVKMTVGRFVAELSPDADFEWQTVIPAADVARSGGVIVIESDRVYLPAVVEGTADQRQLGLRIFECLVEPA
jgi:hypothetical protein